MYLVITTLLVLPEIPSVLIQYSYKNQVFLHHSGGYSPPPPPELHLSSPLAEREQHISWHDMYSICLTWFISDMNLRRVPFMMVCIRATVSVVAPPLVLNQHHCPRQMSASLLMANNTLVRGRPKHINVFTSVQNIHFSDTPPPLGPMTPYTPSH